MTEKPKTFVVTLRADIRDAATVYLMLQENFLVPRNPSELSSMALTLLADLAKNKGFKEFTSTSEALNFLQSSGMVSKDLRSGRNYQTILKQLEIEDGTMHELQTAHVNNLPMEPESLVSEDITQQIQRRLKEFQGQKNALSDFPKEILDEE